MIIKKNNHIFMWRSSCGIRSVCYFSSRFLWLLPKNNLHQPTLHLWTNTSTYKWPSFGLHDTFCVAGRQLSWTTLPTRHHMLSVYRPYRVWKLTIVSACCRDVLCLLLGSQSSTYLPDSALASPWPMLELQELRGGLGTSSEEPVKGKARLLPL